MALVQVLNTNSVAGTSSIIFNNPGLVDEISYGSNSITLSSISQFNLTKSDMLLYFQYLNAFNNSLFLNFPSVSSSVNASWPLSSFSITTSSAGVTHIIYNQTSQDTTVMNINYVPLFGAAGFTARPSPVVISLQEFFMTLYMLSQFINQISLN